MYLPEFEPFTYEVTDSGDKDSSINQIENDFLLKKTIANLNKPTNEEDNKQKRIFCRILFRTPVSNLRSDINGLDLYTVSFFGFIGAKNWFFHFMKNIHITI